MGAGAGAVTLSVRPSAFERAKIGREQNVAKFLKIVGLGCGGCLVLIIGISLLGYSQLEDTMHVERSKVIDAPIEVLFPLVDSLQSWNEWDPWSQIDRAMETSYEGPPAGTGAIRRWTSKDPMVGSGWMEITDSITGERIEFEVHMPENEMLVHSIFRFEETSQGVRVTWTDNAELNGFVQHLFGVAADEFILGPMFDKGLSRLEYVARKRADALSSDPAEEQQEADSAESE